MKKSRIMLTVAALAAVTTAADAGSAFEKVDMVKEGINTSPAIVRANSNGYTGYENSSLKYYVRLFAKAKGSKAVHYVVVQSRSPLFAHSGDGSNGWGVYKKSVAFNAKFNDTDWYVSPKQACDANLNKQMNKGSRKQSVLRKQWKVTAQAKFRLRAEADTKRNNRDGFHHNNTNGSGSRTISYAVPVVCRAGA